MGRWGYNEEMQAFFLNTTTEILAGEELTESYQVSRIGNVWPFMIGFV
jgi:hypothetical protein